MVKGWPLLARAVWRLEDARGSVRRRFWGRCREDWFVVAVGRGLPTGSTLTRPEGLDGFWGVWFTSLCFDRSVSLQLKEPFWKPPPSRRMALFREGWPVACGGAETLALLAVRWVSFIISPPLRGGRAA